MSRNSSQESSAISSFKLIFRSLQQKNYRLFLYGQSISLIGTWMQHIAIAWLVYQITHSVLMLGLIGFASQIPIFLLAPFTGVLTDRWNRHNVLIIAQIVAMVQALILASLYFAGTIEIWHIFILSITWWFEYVRFPDWCNRIWSIIRRSISCIRKNSPKVG